MNEWIERVRVELEELITRVNKLQLFIVSEGNPTEQFLQLSEEQQFLLRSQVQVMFLYIDILERRLEVK